ncbi:hypothetical protein FRC11_002987 [Ceratobasidium sp. 423]|nr:hypothetical protein FRC11_002987 [Ceratobasidium sp. 423]
MDEVFESLAEEQDKPIDPVTMFIKDKIVIEQSKSRSKRPVNPLTWWYAQHVAGHEHDGLTQMAIDILSTPASSVEVECTFSFVSALVSQYRHTMAAYTIQTTATLGTYSRADLVPPGILATAHKKAHEQVQAKARAKAAEAKAQAAAAKAEALAAEEGEEEEEEEGEEEEEEDDEDVLAPSSDFGFEEGVWNEE